MSIVILYLAIGIVFGFIALAIVYDSATVSFFAGDSSSEIMWTLFGFFIVVMFTWPYWVYIFLSA